MEVPYENSHRHPHHHKAYIFLFHWLPLSHRLTKKMKLWVPQMKTKSINFLKNRYFNISKNTITTVNNVYSISLTLSKFLTPSSVVLNSYTKLTILISSWTTQLKTLKSAHIFTLTNNNPHLSLCLLKSTPSLHQSIVHYFKRS